MENFFQSHRNICFEAIQSGGKSEGSRLEVKSVIKFSVAEKFTEK